MADAHVARGSAPREGLFSAVEGADPATSWWRRHPVASYRYAVWLARHAAPEAARGAYLRALEGDPGATEARLDLAEVHRAQGRPDEARAVLEEAGRRDPTRYDVPLRLGHLAVGPEAPPSRRRDLGAAAIEALRRYNDAAALAPWRFETHVAFAKVARRQGNLPEAGRELRVANGMDRERAEILLESFRLAEAEGTPSWQTAGILALALAKEPSRAWEVRREAVEALDAGEAEEKAAIEKARESLSPDFGRADADFEAAALRFTGLLAADLEDPRGLRAEAEAEAGAGRHRRALARFRALLADPYATPEADLAFAAASSASRVDGDLAAQLKARGRVLLGYEALAKGDVPAAVRDFTAAREKEPRSVAAAYGLARALARAGKPAEAATALRAAVDLDPVAGEHASRDPDLSSVWPLVAPRK
jgi:Tfp pilus assembly protein PilF